MTGIEHLSGEVTAAEAPKPDRWERLEPTN